MKALLLLLLLLLLLFSLSSLNQVAGHEDDTGSTFADNFTLPSLTAMLTEDDVLASSQSQDSQNEGQQLKITNCFRKLRLQTRLIVQDNVQLKDARSFYLRCVRGVPYNEYVMNDPLGVRNVSSFIAERQRKMVELLPQYEWECKNAVNVETGILEIKELKVFNSPLMLTGRGNFYLANVMHLEHHADQLEYLVKMERLPPQFFQIVYGIRNKVVPAVVRANGGDACVYSSNNPRFWSGCNEGFRRSSYLLNPWMTDVMGGTFGNLVYLPTPVPRSPENPFCINPNLNFGEIEESYLAGSVLVVDDLLTEVCLNELRKLALESTIFYDAKKSYVGAFIDEGLGENDWLLILSEEFKTRFPRIIQSAPLSTSWMFKYDSPSSNSGGIGIHADQALVNINIWLTPDEANLDKASGGLIVYDTAPPTDEIFKEDQFAKWNDEEFEPFRGQWLDDNDAKHIKINYLCNRAVIFDSRRLHATDGYKFKDGYANKRINLTLLYGDGNSGGGRMTSNGKLTNRYSLH